MANPWPTLAETKAHKLSLHGELLRALNPDAASAGDPGAPTPPTAETHRPRPDPSQGHGADGSAVTALNGDGLTRALRKALRR